MKIRVLFFATLKDILGSNAIDMEVPEGFTVRELSSKVIADHPEIESHLLRAIVAVDKKFAAKEDIIPAGSEVAFFPPVSGGSEYPTIVRVVDDRIHIDDAVEQISTNSTGAVCIFTGIVRGHSQREEGKETASLEYEAYEPMAREKMLQIADEIRKKWPQVEGVAIIQRIGKMNTGTPTVIVACAASHRDTGVFDAARFGIDRLKEIVPVWKKEYGSDGENWIEGDYFPGKAD
jgi:MoaE-MoaD fusion protein